MTNDRNPIQRGLPKNWNLLPYVMEKTRRCTTSGMAGSSCLTTSMCFHFWVLSSPPSMMTNGHLPLQLIPYHSEKESQQNSWEQISMDQVRSYPYLYPSTTVRGMGYTDWLGPDHMSPSVAPTERHSEWEKGGPSEGSTMHIPQVTQVVSGDAETQTLERSKQQISLDSISIVKQECIAPRAQKWQVLIYVLIVSHFNHFYIDSSTGYPSSRVQNQESWDCVPLGCYGIRAM